MKIPELFTYFEKWIWEVPNSKDRVYVIEKARRELGYDPKYNILQILRQ